MLQSVALVEIAEMILVTQVQIVVVLGFGMILETAGHLVQPAGSDWKLWMVGFETVLAEMMLQVVEKNLVAAAEIDL